MPDGGVYYLMTQKPTARPLEELERIGYALYKFVRLQMDKNPKR